MATPSSFLIAGGTGRQGGAVVNALLEDHLSPVNPNQIFVITRNIEGFNAAKLATRGINLIAGTLSKPELIFNDLKNFGVKLNETAAFLVQAHGPTEFDDARRFIDAAATSGLQYFVYSSVDRGGKELSDKDPSYCKTFSDKFHIEKHLITTTSRSDVNESSSEKMKYTILRPVWFAENAIWGFPGKLCMTGWRENMNGKSMQVVVAKDLGRWAAEALLRPDRAGLRNEAVSIASDKLSFEEVDEIFRQETGQPASVTYGWLARFVIWAVNDMYIMFRFIDERDYGADLDWLSKTIKPTTFREWVRESVGIKEE